MTHKPPQGIDAPNCAHKQLKKQMVGEQFWYVCECGQKFRVELWDGKVSVLAPPDRRKDLAALQQAARKVELSVEEVRQLTLKSWPREHSNPPDVEEWRATIAALIRNNIDLKYALAEMRGAKR